jgi:hypothetical protein
MVRGSPSTGDRDPRDGTSRAGTWAGPAHSCPLAPLRKVELYRLRACTRQYEIGATKVSVSPKLFEQAVSGFGATAFFEPA